MIPEEPIEPADDGCPAGWAHSPFASSVHRYVRRRFGDGGRVDSPAFASASWQAQEAATYLEDQQERWHTYRSEVDHERWRRAQPAKKKDPKSGRH